MRTFIGVLCLGVVVLAGTRGHAQDFDAGLNGWQLERLSEDFVLLRTDLFGLTKGKRQERQGLLMLSCEPGIRRVRFQIGDIPRSPSIRASSQGRAIVRVSVRDQLNPSLPIYPNVHLFDDGSFEFREVSAFGDSVMRGMLNMLRKTPDRLEVVLFKGSETKAFQTGTAMQFRLHGLENDLGNLYGFEGLCFHAAR